MVNRLNSQQWPDFLPAGGESFNVLEEIYLELFENSHEIMLIISPEDGQIRDANRSACEFYGHAKRYLTSLKFSELAADSKDHDLMKFRRGTIRQMQLTQRIADGETKAVEVLMRPISFRGLTYHLVTVLETSAGRIYQNGLKICDSFLVEVFENCHVGISLLDKDLTIRCANRVMETWYESSAPLVGKKCHEAYHGRNEPCRPCPSLRCIESGKTEHDIVTGLPGSPAKWMEVYSCPVFDRVLGDISRVVEIVRDITHYKLAESALKESEEKYRKLVENANEAIFIAQDGAIKFPNPKTLELLGETEKGWAEVPFIDFVHPEDRQMVLDMHCKRLAGNKHLPSTYSFKVVSRHGKEYLVELNAVTITWEGRAATLNFVRDLTEQKKLEAGLYQAQKMEAIGTLAGGIAHDFNNLLMGIQGRTSLMLSDIDPAHPHAGHLKRIEEHVKSATELTRQLLGFARGGKYEVKPTNLNDIVQKTATLFGRTSREVMVKLELEAELWSSEVDRSQIEQVLLNLCVNAGQAMPGGGELHLKTTNQIVGPSCPVSHEVGSGNYVRISVTDTGVGMDQSTKARIFEPFFTTREMGRGTGLGLASAYGIVKNHNGIITVHSEIGRGTSFHIYLPASHKEAVRSVGTANSALPGVVTVLLVDDEELILNVGRLMLEKLGCKVYCADNGKDAVEIFRKKKKEIDFILLDMIMPGMGGGETFDRLKTLDEHIKVILSSGYSLNDQASEILNRGCSQFIQKPFNIRELSEIIRKTMGKPSS
jgi:PAS domain S-box-containing protein